MRFVIAIALAALASSPSLAETCSVIGNSAVCDNGPSEKRIGNSTNNSDGTSSKNRYATSSNRIGNKTLDGLRSYRIGNKTFFSDGTTCTRIGNSTFCN